MKILTNKSDGDVEKLIYTDQMKIA